MCSPEMPNSGTNAKLFERSEFLIATSPQKNMYFVRVFD